MLKSFCVVVLFVVLNLQDLYFPALRTNFSRNKGEVTRVIQLFFNFPDK